MPLDLADVALMVGELAARQALSKERERAHRRRAAVCHSSLSRRGSIASATRARSRRSARCSGAIFPTLLRAVGGVDNSALQSSLDRLVDADLLFVEGSGRQAIYRFKHALIQDAAYESLLRSRRQALHRCAAEILRDEPERAAAEPELIAHHFTEAGLDDLGIEWWGKTGDQALRRSAFQEAISHLGKAIAMADRARHRHAKGASGQRRHLQAAYGNALIAARGYGAPETTEAFAAVRESGYRGNVEPERLAADYGLWVGSCVRGELAAMRAHAAAFRRDFGARPESPEAGIAQRILGATH